MEGDYPIEIHIHLCDAQTGERIPYLVDLLIGKDATMSGEEGKLYTILNADQMESELIPLLDAGACSSEEENP